MKKRIVLLIIILLLTTGCTCEYNLTIDGSKYKEKITIISETTDEESKLNNKWEIPVDKDESETPGDPNSDIKIEGDIYNYNLSNNKLIFNYDFTRSRYINSTAVSKCYKKLTISNYDNTTIISTSPNANCFDNYPTLTNIKVTINVDREVINHNADNVNGNIYTWTINKNNASNKSINLTLKNIDKNIKPDSTTNNEKNNLNNQINNYALYIFIVILVIIIFLGYKWFMNFKEKNNSID